MTKFLANKANVKDNPELLNLNDAVTKGGNSFTPWCPWWMLAL